MPLLALSLFFISCEKAIDTGPHVTVIYDGQKSSTYNSGNIEYGYTLCFRVINNGFCKINEVDLRFTCFFADSTIKVIDYPVYDLLDDEEITIYVSSSSPLYLPIQQEVFIQPQCGCETR